VKHRDEKGRFVKGNPGNPQAKGRPKKEREERYYEIAISAVTFPDWKKIIQKAGQQAKSGDAAARRFLADYLLGKPAQEVRLETRGDMAIMLQWDDGYDNDNETAAAPATTGDSPEQGEIQGDSGGEEIREDQAGSD